MSRSSRSSRLVRSLSALPAWAVLCLSLALAVPALFGAKALHGYLTRVVLVPAPPARASFLQHGSTSGSLIAELNWVEAAPPPGFEVHGRSGSGGSGLPEYRDATPAGAWRTVRLETVEDSSSYRYSLVGPADRAALRAYYGGPFRDVVRAALAEWEPGATVTPLADPDPPPYAGLQLSTSGPSAWQPVPPDADVDVWGAAYAAERAGGVHEGTVVWCLAPSSWRDRPDWLGEHSFDLTVRVGESRWTDR